MIQNNSYDADTLHEECGVFGMYDFDGADVASTIYYGLFALQLSWPRCCRAYNALYPALTMLVLPVES